MSKFEETKFWSVTGFNAHDDLFSTFLAFFFEIWSFSTKIVLGFSYCFFMKNILPKFEVKLFFGGSLKTFFTYISKNGPFWKKNEITIWGSFVYQKTVYDIQIDIFRLVVRFWVDFW